MKYLSWKSLGRIIEPSVGTPWWLESFAGSACAVIRNNGPLFDLYITGRDEFNRSRIGHGIWSAETPDKILQLDDDPCLGLGKHGSFFDSGTSYPSVIKYKNKYLMYFTGWHQGKKTPFINSMGLAESKNADGMFHPISESSFFPAIASEMFGIGTPFCYFDHEQNNFTLFYSSFTEWLKIGASYTPQYHIRKVIGLTPYDFERPGVPVLPSSLPLKELSCRPSLTLSHSLIFCKRKPGTKYSIFATPKVENNQWKDQARRISILGTSNWDSEELCYPFAFSYNDQEFLLYSGNGYGRSGLGIAILCN